MRLRPAQSVLPALLLSALAAAPASGSTVAPAANARIDSLKVAPARVRVDRSTTITWDLTGRATTTFTLERCSNARCSASSVVGSSIKRRGSVGLNSFKLTVSHLRPARYKLVARTAANSRRVLFTVVK